LDFTRCPDGTPRRDLPCTQPDADPEWWFPVGATGAVAEQELAEAKARCGPCPVWEACLDYAIESKQLLVGIWGGTDEHERGPAAARPKENRMSAEITAYTPPAQSEIDYTWNLANKLCKTEFVPSNLRNKPEAVLAVFLTGRELGIGPMQSLRDIYPVNGRPALMATLMVNRVRGLGHRFKTVKSTDQEAVVQIHRGDQPEPEPELRFTLADAKRAELIGKENWRKYPTAMLWSRAAAAACRRDAPEALGGAVYTPEEIEDGQGTTTASWGAPEPPQQSDPATATPRGPAGSDPTSEEGPAAPPDDTRDNGPVEVPSAAGVGHVRGARRPGPGPSSGPTSEAHAQPIATRAGKHPGAGASDPNASVTGHGDTDVSAGHEPPNTEASTPAAPASPGAAGQQPGRRTRDAAKGKRGEPDHPPAGPQQDTLDTEPEPPGWD
jgi:hypothetical protein